MAKLSDLNLESKYPEYCCLPCLFAAGGKSIKRTIDSYKTGKCPVCGKRTHIVSTEDFGYPILRIKNEAIEHEEEQ